MGPVFTLLFHLHQESESERSSQRAYAEVLDLELMFSDLDQISRRIERVEKDLKKKKEPILEQELVLLHRCQAAIESEKPLRFAVSIGNRRPLYCTAAGKAMLAFLPKQAQCKYLAETKFVKFTFDTSSKEELRAMFPQLLFFLPPARMKLSRI